MITKLLHSTFFRFLLMGGTNTVIVYVIYRLLLSSTNYQIAYSVSFVVGILTAYLMNSLFTFRAPVSWRVGLRYPLISLVQYLLNFGLLYIEVTLGFDERYAPLVNVVLIIPVSFWMNKKLLHIRNPL